MHKKSLIPVVLLLVSLVAVGCGGGETASDTPSSSAPQESAPVAATPAGTANISGTINFSGMAPEAQALRLDRECTDLHDGPVNAQRVVVNENGTLRWVFIYVKEGLEGQTFAAPSEPVVFDQSGCMYDPHVFGVQVGQTIKILNSDPFLHNINASPKENRPFNLGMPKQGDERERSFRAPEVMVPVKCDVHPWMSAFVGVLPHPYYSVSAEDGTFSIEGLPAGTYTIEAWHEEYGTQTQSVTVGDGETQTADFSFDGSAS